MVSTKLGKTLVITTLCIAIHCTLLLHPCLANEPGEQGATSEYETQFNSALNAYFSGGHKVALTTLESMRASIRAGAEIDPALTTDVYIYIGEIQYILGDYAGARRTFQELLTTSPNTSIDPRLHPNDVVGLFEQVKNKTRQRDDTSSPMPQNIPLWTYMPYGVPQFLQSRPKSGFAYAISQAGFSISSIAVYSHLKSRNGTTSNPKQWGVQEYDDAYQSIQMERYLIQWPLTAAFYVAWASSHISARNLISEPQVSITLIPTPENTTAFGLAGRF